MKPLLFLFVILLVLPGACMSPPSRAAVAAKHDGTLTDPNIRYIGRWDRSDPAVYHGYWSGVYLRTGFTGTSIGIKLAERTGLAVSIDGEPLRMLSGGLGVTPLNTAPLKPDSHTLDGGQRGPKLRSPLSGPGFGCRCGDTACGRASLD